MAKTGIVSQLTDGTVFKCSLWEECMKSNNSIPNKKNCLLSVDHSDRCHAWGIEQSTWLIHSNIELIEEL